MADVARKRATLDDLGSVPPTWVAEIVDGDLVAHPRPALPHAGAATSLGLELGSPFQRGRGGPGGWVFLFEPELHLGDDVLVPDLAGWRRERAPDMTAPFASVAPDWVGEVLSERTRSTDRVRKMPIYGRVGVRHVWLIDPVARTLEVFRRHDAGWLLVAAFGGDAVVRAEPFDAADLDLATLWNPLA